MKQEIKACILSDYLECVCKTGEISCRVINTKNHESDYINGHTSVKQEVRVILAQTIISESARIYEISCKVIRIIWAEYKIMTG